MTATIVRKPIDPLPPLAPGEYGKHATERRQDERIVAESMAASGHYRPPREGWDRWLAKREAARRRTADIPYESAPAGYCRWCGLDIGATLRRNPRRRWHPACADAYLRVQSQGALRKRVWERDGGICIDCPTGTPPYPLHTIRRFPCGTATPAFNGNLCPLTRRYERGDFHARTFGRVNLIHPHVCGKVYRHGWEADHVVEIVDGGIHELDNMVTRCLTHHVAKTTEARRARRMPR